MDLYANDSYIRRIRIVFRRHMSPPCCKYLVLINRRTACLFTYRVTIARLLSCQYCVLIHRRRSYVDLFYGILSDYFYILRKGGRNLFYSSSHPVIVTERLEELTLGTVRITLVLHASAICIQQNQSRNYMSYPMSENEKIAIKDFIYGSCRILFPYYQKKKFFPQPIPFPHF